MARVPRAKPLLRVVLLLAAVGLAACGRPPAPPPLGESATKEQRRLIAEHVAAPERRDALLRLIDEVESRLAEHQRLRDAHYARIRALARDHAATARDFRPLLADFDAEYEGMLRFLVEARSRARTLTTDEEWKAIAGKAAYL